MADDRVPETSIFIIGGEEVHVPVLSFYDLERLRDKIDAIQTGMDWIEYGRMVLRIASQLLSPDEAEESQETFIRLQKKCSIREMRQLGAAFNELLFASGFDRPGEALAATDQASPGTGTSTASSPNLPSGEFAEATPTGSNVH